MLFGFFSLGGFVIGQTFECRQRLRCALYFLPQSEQTYDDSWFSLVVVSGMGGS
jgi:hypothetical protein